MSEFTKGPWKIGGQLAEGYSIKAPGRDFRIAIAIRLGNQKDAAQANAHLIAAAPELLEELIILRDWLAEELGEWLPVYSSHYPNEQLKRMKENYDSICAAIAKTEVVQP
uniref:Uncharacterized protein n=1 Tax=viral metagenome TaxID=1070528 RepID=A0A6H1ZV15_9ZZZZ